MRHALKCFRLSMLAVAVLTAVLPAARLGAQEMVDAVSYFRDVEAEHGAGLARKTRPVDARPAEPGEVIVTMIKGEGKETESPPASPGDMVVRNRCPETGNEEILVTAAKFPQCYEGPIAGPASDGWSTYRPLGVEMRFIVVADDEGTFSFIAP